MSVKPRGTAPNGTSSRNSRPRRSWICSQRQHRNWLLPVAGLEQIGNGIAKSRKEFFAFEERTGANQPPLSQRVANLDRFVIRINDPRELRAAGKKILQPLVNSAAGIVRRENFDGQIWRAWKEAIGLALESE